MSASFSLGFLYQIFVHHRPLPPIHQQTHYNSSYKGDKVDYSENYLCTSIAHTFVLKTNSTSGSPCFEELWSMQPASPGERFRLQLEPPTDLLHLKALNQLSLQVEDNTTKRFWITTPNREMLGACQRPTPMLELDSWELQRAEMS